MDVNYKRHDSMLMELLEEKKTIVSFLDSIFGFFSRCTDFYHEMKSPEDKIGFPPGLNERLVLDILRKHKPMLREQPTLVDNSIVPEAVTEEIVIDAGNSEEEEVQSTINAGKSTLIFQPSEYYNGAQYENYCWSQTINEIELHVRLPDELSNGKKIAVDINHSEITVSEKENRMNKIITGQLTNKCKANESIWSITGKNVLQISIEKQKELWWDKLFVSETPIDLRQIDCSKNIEEMPEDSQLMVDRMRWDQQQRMNRQPTSEELEKIEILKKAWNLDGSPFKGQPFDPNVLK